MSDDIGPRSKKLNSQTKAEVQTIFVNLVADESFLKSRRQRVVAMICIRRLVTHTDDSHVFDLETSELGQWCLQSLQSSIRELRIAAG